MAKIITKNGLISSSAGIEFQTGASASLFVSSSGIGIGTDSPSASLDIEDGFVLLPEILEPPLPSSGKGAIYMSGSDSRIYLKNDLGDVFDLTQVGSGSVTGGLDETTHKDLDTLLHNLEEDYDLVPVFDSHGIVTSITARDQSGSPNIRIFDDFSGSADGLLVRARARQYDSSGVLVKTLSVTGTISSSVPTELEVNES